MPRCKGRLDYLNRGDGGGGGDDGDNHDYYQITTVTICCINALFTKRG